MVNDDKGEFTMAHGEVIFRLILALLGHFPVQGIISCRAYITTLQQGSKWSHRPSQLNTPMAECDVRLLLFAWAYAMAMTLMCMALISQMVRKFQDACLLDKFCS